MNMRVARATMEATPAPVAAAEAEAWPMVPRVLPREVPPRYMALAVTFGLHLAVILALLIQGRSIGIVPAPEALTVTPLVEQPEPVEPPKLPPTKVSVPRLSLPTVEVPPSTEPSPNAITVPVTPPQVQPAPSRSTIETYQAKLARHFARYKVYPPESRSRHEQGVVLVTFTIDRAGTVLGYSIQRGSGFTALDAATLAMIARASPLPPPPPEMARDRLRLTFPIEYVIH